MYDAPYWLIDIIPRQVPQDSAGQYFAVERYLRGRSRIKKTHGRFVRLLLKLNCYYDLAFSHPNDPAQLVNPSPKKLRQLVMGCHEATGDRRTLCIDVPSAGASMTFDGDDLYLTLWHPSEQLLEDIQALAGSEGLFVWRHE